MAYIDDPVKWQIDYADNWDMYQYLFWTVSQKKKFVFIHVPRCAGTSIDVNIRGHVNDALRAVYVDPKKYDKFYKFAFVRNPWDRLVSAYFQYKKNAHVKLSGFTQFVHEVVLIDNHDKMWATQPKSTYDHWFPYRYFIGPLDDPHVDFIGRFETLESDLDKISERINVGLNVGHSAKTRSKRANDYHHYYDDRLKNIVGDFFAEDIAHFNYDF